MAQQAELSFEQRNAIMCLSEGTRVLRSNRTFGRWVAGGWTEQVAPEIVEGLKARRILSFERIKNAPGMSWIGFEPEFGAQTYGTPRPCYWTLRSRQARFYKLTAEHLRVLRKFREDGVAVFGPHKLDGTWWVGRAGMALTEADVAHLIAEGLIVVTSRQEGGEWVEDSAGLTAKGRAWVRRWYRDAGKPADEREAA